MVLNRGFYNRDPAEVAEDLLGRLMVCESSEGKVSGYIVETESYYGEDDPASRAAQNGKTDMTSVMWMEPGTVFVYMVHGHWMLNVVTGEEDEPSAVLFRAMEPEEGLKLMRERREREKLKELCSGPGKLTQAMGIDKSFNKGRITSENGFYVSEERLKDFEVGRSKRIGVTEDLETPLRFYIEGNDFTSR